MAAPDEKYTIPYFRTHRNKAPHLILERTPLHIVDNWREIVDLVRAGRQAGDSNKPLWGTGHSKDYDLGWEKPPEGNNGSVMHPHRIAIREALESAAASRPPREMTVLDLTDSLRPVYGEVFPGGLQKEVHNSVREMVKMGIIKTSWSHILPHGFYDGAP